MRQDSRARHAQCAQKEMPLHCAEHIGDVMSPDVSAVADAFSRPPFHTVLGQESEAHRKGACRSAMHCGRRSRTCSRLKNHLGAKSLEWPCIRRNAHMPSEIVNGRWPNRAGKQRTFTSWSCAASVRNRSRVPPLVVARTAEESSKDDWQSLRLLPLVCQHGAVPKLLLGVFTACVQNSPFQRRHV